MLETGTALSQHSSHTSKHRCSEGVYLYSQRQVGSALLQWQCMYVACIKRYLTARHPSVVLQSLKDAIMVTAGGAEALPFLASFCVLPASVAFFVLYGKLVRHNRLVNAPYR